LGKRALGMWLVRAPHHLIDADQVAVADAQRVFLEAQEDVAVEEVAGQALLEPVPPRAPRALGVRVVEPVEEEGNPAELVLDRADPEPRVPRADPGEDAVRETGLPVA